ncbi:MAG: 2-iminoacetate synthase ThiH [PVC group bacterium]
MSFAEQLDTVDLVSMRSRIDSMRERDVEAVLSGKSTDFLPLLSPAAVPQLEVMAQRARNETVQRFGREILLYAPMYLSNHCINGCRYCGFHSGAATARVALSEEEVIEEGRHLRDIGFQHVLVVSGESPSHFSTSRLRSAIRVLAPMFSSISIEVQPFSTIEYSEMAEAGADGVTLYQETYLREVYSQMHLFGPKRDFAARLDAIERAGQAGIRRLGIGALLGLGDFRAEAIALMLHAEYLLKRFWRSQLTISIPRLRKRADGGRIPNPLSDLNLVQLLLALRIHLPEAGLVLSTREPADLRDQLIRLGITQMSAGSRTEPGGYRRATPAGEQFAVTDRRSPAEVVEAVCRAGFNPVWKDWDREMNQGVSH